MTINTTATTGTEAARTNSRLANAWISGIWYDSGDVVTGDEGRHDCSPVDDKTTPGTVADKATLPESSDRWRIEENNTTTVVRTLTRAL